MVIANGSYGIKINMDLASAYKNSSVFITGPAGFKASWLHKMRTNILGYFLEPDSIYNYFMSNIRDLLHEGTVAQFVFRTTAYIYLEGLAIICSGGLIHIHRLVETYFTETDFKYSLLFSDYSYLDYEPMDEN